MATYASPLLRIGKASRARTCPKWQVGGEAHFALTTAGPTGHVLHSELNRRDMPSPEVEARSFHCVLWLECRQG
jgi:hypothetical protein